MSDRCVANVTYVHLPIMSCPCFVIRLFVRFVVIMILPPGLYVGGNLISLLAVMILEDGDCRCIF